MPPKELFFPLRVTRLKFYFIISAKPSPPKLPHFSSGLQVEFLDDERFAEIPLGRHAFFLPPLCSNSPASKTPPHFFVPKNFVFFPKSSNVEVFPSLDLLNFCLWFCVLCLLSESCQDFRSTTFFLKH